MNSSRLLDGNCMQHTPIALKTNMQSVSPYLDGIRLKLNQSSSVAGCKHNRTMMHLLHHVEFSNLYYILGYHPAA
jgi:hypothetical protein